MGNSTTFDYKGTPCYFKFLQFEGTSKTRKMICSIGGEELKADDGFYICINNFVLFPNVFLSKYIIDSWGFEKCIDCLISEWNTIKELKQSALLKRWGLKVLDEELENPYNFCNC